MCQQRGLACIPAGACTHTHVCTRTCVHGQTHRAAEREVSAFISTHINTHSTQTDMNITDGLIPFLLPGRLGLESGYMHTLILDSQTHIWGFLEYWHKYKSIQYTWPIPTHRLRLWLFPYMDLFLLCSCSNLKFMSSLHTQAQGVTHTENS